MTYRKFPARPAGEMAKRAVGYARQIDSGKIPTSNQVRWECARFLRRVASKEWMYDEAAVERAGKFIQRLPFPEGEYNTPRVVLGDWQCMLLASLLGWRSRSDPERRAIRECMIAVPRKAGKSALAAFIALVDLCLSGRNNGRIVCAGPTEHQAKYPYDKAVAVIHRSADLRNRFSLVASGSQIRRRDELGGTMITTSGNARTQDGENPSMVIMEEIHAEENPNALGIHRSAFGARRDPLLLMPTTAGDSAASVGIDEREGYLRQCETANGFDTTFGMLYEAHKDDDPTDPSIWRKAQPSMGLTIGLDYYGHMCNTAQGDDAKMQKFKTRQLNMWVGGDAKILIDIDEWRALPEVKKDWRRHPVLQNAWIGVDLSEVEDLASITLLGQLRNGMYAAWWEVWVSGRAADNAEANKNTKGVGGQARYADWIKEGMLHRSRTPTIDYSELSAVIAKMCDRHRVKEIVSDAYAGVAELQEALPQRRRDLVSRMRKTANTYTRPTRALLRMVAERKLSVFRNPVVDWNIANCVAERRIDGSILAKKITEASPDKIDCVDSLIVSIAGRDAALVRAGKGSQPISMLDSGALSGGRIEIH